MEIHVVIMGQMLAVPTRNYCADGPCLCLGAGLPDFRPLHFLVE